MACRGLEAGLARSAHVNAPGYGMAARWDKGAKREQFAGRLLAVGWLKYGKPFPGGTVTESLFEKLCQLLYDPWSPVCMAGIQTCDLCQFTGGASESFHGYPVFGSRSALALFVPGSGVTYVAPVSIAHYIDAHRYRPPDVFCQAVLDCPPMRSMAYFRALLANGARDMVRTFLAAGPA